MQVEAGYGLLAVGDGLQDLLLRDANLRAICAPRVLLQLIRPKPNCRAGWRGPIGGVKVLPKLSESPRRPAN